MGALISFALNQAGGLAAGVVATAALLILYNTAIENPQVRHQERDLVIAEQRAATMALIEQRSKDNAEITTFDAAHLCGELGGRWVPDEKRCD
jgi:hypothetical protein